MSLGHSQPSHCLLSTQLLKQTGITHPRATICFEQHKDPSSILLLFSGKIDHENKADDKENSNANLENTVRISSSALALFLFQTHGLWTAKNVSPQCRITTTAKNCNGSGYRCTFLGPFQALGFLPFCSYGKLSPVCPLILLYQLWEGRKAQRVELRTTSWETKANARQ